MVVLKHFITFCGGNNNYYEAGRRLIDQAQNINLFDKTILYSHESLMDDNDFWSRHSNFIENNKRGFGYWLWKPYIIKKTMENCVDGDILLYLDCGCEININKKNIFNLFFELLENEYIIGSLSSCNENVHNKMDLIVKLNMRDDKYLNTLQHQAGALFIHICDKTRSMVNEWYELACDYHNIDDTPSIEENLGCFQEHRHDQSIFSLLTKKYGLFSNTTIDTCIEYIRNRTGTPRF
jgi:hypothetical protein